MIQTKERIRVVFADDIPMCEANFSILRANETCQAIALMWTHKDITNREISEALLHGLEFQFGVDGEIYSVDTVYDTLMPEYWEDDAYTAWKCRQKALFEFAGTVGWWFNECGLFAWAKQQHKENK